MKYVTVFLSPRHHQMTFEEFLFGGDTFADGLITTNKSNTRTYEVAEISPLVRKKVYIPGLIATLRRFNRSVDGIREADRHSLYDTFYIPKRSGGLRKINDPNNALSSALRELKRIFEEEFHALYHTSAFAYVKGRSTIDAVKRHQENESKWFAKFDLHDFFGSTTIDFVLGMLKHIFPFCEIMETEEGKYELRQALELAFLDGGLPQGTPISPMLTNLMMIPVDYILTNRLRNFEKQSFVYTRYADDFIISSRYDFDYRKIENLIKGVLTDFKAPFSLNTKKTRYGSSAGRNWNLGVMLNADNQITVGAKKKREFKAMLTSYILDRKNGTPWNISDIQVMEGLHSYYSMVEGEVIEEIIRKLSEKFGEDIKACIREDLRI